MSAAQRRDGTVTGSNRPLQLPPAHDDPEGSRAGRCTAPLWAIAVAVASVTALCLPGLAQAEQCSAEGKICLVTEATAEHPFESLQTVQVRVASEATRVVMTGGKPVQLIQQGPPGGMSLWQGTLGIFEQDGTSTLSVEASGFQAPSYGAYFPDQPVRAAVADRFNMIKRVGNRYILTFSFTARMNVTAHQEFILGTCLGPHRWCIRERKAQVVETGPGPHTLSLSFPVKAVQRFCRERCFFATSGSITVDGTELHFTESAEGFADALLVKRPRLQCLKRVRKLQQQARQFKQPRLNARSKRLKQHCYWYAMRPE